MALFCHFFLVLCHVFDTAEMDRVGESATERRRKQTIDEATEGIKNDAVQSALRMYSGMACTPVIRTCGVIGAASGFR